MPRYRRILNKDNIEFIPTVFYDYIHRISLKPKEYDSCTEVIGINQVSGCICTQTTWRDDGSSILL